MTVLGMAESLPVGGQPPPYQSVIQQPNQQVPTQYPPQGMQQMAGTGAQDVKQGYNPGAPGQYQPYQQAAPPPQDDSQLISFD